MKILAIGDVVGSAGCKFLREKLPILKSAQGIDLVIANGENSADGNGITPFSANFLFESGVDVITTGNHAFRRREIYSKYDEDERLIRPANFPNFSTPGSGVYTLEMVGNKKVIIINLMGTIFMENLENPFYVINRILKNVDDNCIKIIDFHAEATAEKRGLGFFLDGRVSAIFGTHTHVPTADACVLPRGTGYISDAGMTGPIHSVLGIKPEIAIRKMKTKLPVKFEYAPGNCKMDCVIFDIDEENNLSRSVKQLTVI